MADLDDFFAKKDKKKKTKKGFSKANTEVLAKNLEENDRKEQQAEEKANDMASRGQRFIENQQGLSKEVSRNHFERFRLIQCLNYLLEEANCRQNAAIFNFL